MFVTYPSFNSYWAPASLRVYVATNTFAALMCGGMFAFIWSNLIYPEGPSVMHLQDGVLAGMYVSWAIWHACMLQVCVYVSACDSCFEICFLFLTHGSSCMRALTTYTYTYSCIEKSWERFLHIHIHIHMHEHTLTHALKNVGTDFFFVFFCFWTAGVAASTPACMFIDPVFMMLVGAGNVCV